MGADAERPVQLRALSAREAAPTLRPRAALPSPRIPDSCNATFGGAAHGTLPITACAAWARSQRGPKEAPEGTLRGGAA
jgi:hypothetical protein